MNCAFWYPATGWQCTFAGDTGDKMENLANMRPAARLQQGTVQGTSRGLIGDKLSIYPPPFPYHHPPCTYSSRNAQRRKRAQKCLPLAHRCHAASVDNFVAMLNSADAYLLSNASSMRNPLSALKNSLKAEKLSFFAYSTTGIMLSMSRKNRNTYSLRDLC